MPCLLRSAVLLLALTVPVEAGDGRDVFMGVLQGFAGELERQNSRQQHDANVLMRACFEGSEPACDVALKQSWLSPSDRRAVRNQRQHLAAQRLAEQRAYDVFVQYWNACRDQHDVQACSAALSYDDLSSGDRQVLVGWHDAAVRRVQNQERQARAAAQADEQEREAETENTTFARPAIADVPMTTGSITAAPRAKAVSPDPVIVTVLLLLISACGVAFLWAVHGGPAQATTAEREQAFKTHHFAAESDLPLTGHFPTDVRRALAC
jgi:hypothetical protein